VKLNKVIIDLYHRLEELERRIENRSRTGTIEEVDAAKGLARVKLGVDPVTQQPYLSPWIPWKEISMGKIKTHFPPTKGEQVQVVSESGDITDAVIDYSLPSNQNKRPHDKEGEAVIQIGDKFRLLMSESTFHLKVPSKRVESGKIEFQNENSSIATPPSVSAADIPMS